MLYVIDYGILHSGYRTRDLGRYNWIFTGINSYLWAYFLKASKTKRDALAKKVEEERKSAEADRRVIMEQLKPSNGKTVAQVVELVNDKIDMLDSKVALVNEKVDEHHKIVLARMDEHESDDTGRFDALENIIKKESGNIQGNMVQ